MVKYEKNSLILKSIKKGGGRALTDIRRIYPRRKID